MTTAAPTSDRTGSDTTPTASPLRRWAPPVVALVLAVLAWWLATAACPPESLLRQTAPDRAVVALVGLVERGVLLPDALISLWRLLLGLCVAGVLGIPLGLLIGLSRTADRAAAPLVAFLRMVSPLSWTPIALALFGIGSQPVVFLIAAAAVWPIVLSTVAGVHAIRPGHLEVARTFHPTRFEVVTAVVLPAVRAHVLTGLRLALGIGWIVLVPAEMLGVRSGLGYQILNARDQLAYDQVVAVILVVGVLGSVLDLVARGLLSPERSPTR